MEPEHETVQVIAELKAVSMRCSTCKKTGTASWAETDDPEALAEERLYALACNG